MHFLCRFHHNHTTPAVARLGTTLRQPRTRNPRSTLEMTQLHRALTKCLWLCRIRCMIIGTGCDVCINHLAAVMRTLAQEQRNLHKALVLSILLVYTLITWTIPLLHDDDCSATHGIPNPGTSLPCNDACPACKFLAGSYAMENPCSLGLIVIPAETTFEAPPDCQVVVVHSHRGSIILRGPPVVSPFFV